MKIFNDMAFGKKIEQERKSVLRCNIVIMLSVSVLETQKSLVLVEKGSGDSEDVELIRAASAFRLVATMNPGGDFGKKEVNKEIKERSLVKLIQGFTSC